MKIWSKPIAAASLLAVVHMASTSPVIAQSASETVRPGAPGEPSSAVTAEGAGAGERPGYTEADVRFMQGMIPHHAQALDMTSLVPTRSDRRDVHLLAERIEVSQMDEIAWMQRWLEDHHEEVPGLDAHRHHHGAGSQVLMPGMLTPEEMAQLASTTGDEFDRLFLRFMIRHHEGALTMVADLLAAQGAAQASDVFRIASDIEADQQADIKRMRAMLDKRPAASEPH